MSSSATNVFNVPLFGGVARDGIIPPKDGPSITGVKRIWYISLGVLYIFVGFLYSRDGYFGNLLFYPLIFLDALIVYKVYQRYVGQMEIDNQEIRFADLFR